MNKALLIGINTYQYINPQLTGCENDIEDIKSLLVSTGAVSETDVTRLLNDKATRQGVVDAIKDLVTNAQVGDHLYIHFSGHGAQLPCSDPQEPDGRMKCCARTTSTGPRIRRSSTKISEHFCRL